MKRKRRQKDTKTSSSDVVAFPGKHWDKTLVVDLLLILIHFLSIPTGFKDEGRLYDLEPIYNPNNGIKMGVKVWGVRITCIIWLPGFVDMLC